MKCDTSLTGEMHMPSLVMIADKEMSLTENTQLVSGRCFLIALSYIYSSKKKKKPRIINCKPEMNHPSILRKRPAFSHFVSCDYFNFWLNLVLMICCVSSHNSCHTQADRVPPLPWQGGDNIVTGRR